MDAGLCEAVCAHATAQAAENAEYADSLKAVVEKLPEQRLQVLPSAFPRSQLAWVGGSVFASLKVRLNPAIRSPLLHSLQQTHNIVSLSFVAGICAVCRKARAPS
jgi:hypothetical protein